MLIHHCHRELLNESKSSSPPALSNLNELDEGVIVEAYYQILYFYFEVGNFHSLGHNVYQGLNLYTF